MIRALVSLVCQYLPIKRNKILFVSHLGKGYGCNPKYICEYLRKQHSGEFILHWVYDPTCSTQDDIPDGVIPISLYSWRFVFDILTCGFLISNTRLPLWFNYKNRAGQCYIQTWHSSLRLKKIERDANLGNEYERLARSDASKTSVIVSGCNFSSEIYKNSFWYNGPLLEVGTPRLDFLLNQNELSKATIINKVHLDEDYHYVLYAPTFRKDGKLDAYNIDYKLLIDNLTLKFGGKWRVLFRLHPNLLGKISLLNLTEDCADVSSYADIQELLVIADMLITDFSSCMFDVAFMRKPCILYASDYHEYIEKERDLYFDVQSLPFPLVTTNDDLISIISDWNQDKYTNDIDKFLMKVGTYETGISCRCIYNYLKGQLT